MNFRIMPLLAILAIPPSGCEKVGESGGKIVANRVIRSCRNQSKGNLPAFDRCLLGNMQLGPYQSQCGDVKFDECKDDFVSTLGDMRTRAAKGKLY